MPNARRIAKSSALLPVLLAKAPYDPVRDFAPITLALDTPLIFVVPAVLPAKNLPEMIALAKVKSNAVADQLMGLGGDAIGNPPDELRQFLQGEIDSLSKLIRQANVTPNT